MSCWAEATRGSSASCRRASGWATTTTRFWVRTNCGTNTLRTVKKNVTGTLLSLPRQKAFQIGLDQHRGVQRIDAGGGKSAASEEKAFLRGSRIHISEFVVGPDPPNRADAVGDVIAEHFSNP